MKYDLKGKHYCPICGKLLVENHRCKKSVLVAIDAANTRAWNAELNPASRTLSDIIPNKKTRLIHGFKIIKDCLFEQED